MMWLIVEHVWEQNRWREVVKWYCDNKTQAERQWLRIKREKPERSYWLVQESKVAA